MNSIKNNNNNNINNNYNAHRFVSVCGIVGHALSIFWSVWDHDSRVEHLLMCTRQTESKKYEQTQKFLSRLSSLRSLRKHDKSNPKFWTNSNFKQIQHSNKPKSFQVGSARFGRSAKTSQIKKFEQTQQFLSGRRSLRSLRKNYKPNPRNLNKLSIRANPKVSEWTPLASLDPQKQQTESKKYK